MKTIEELKKAKYQLLNYLGVINENLNRKHLSAGSSMYYKKKKNQVLTRLDIINAALEME